MTERISVREARKDLSRILASGKTVSIGRDGYQKLRGFIVGVAPHGAYNQPEKRKALSAAKAAFTTAFLSEWER